MTILKLDISKQSLWADKTRYELVQDRLKWGLRIRPSIISQEMHRLDVSTYD